MVDAVTICTMVPMHFADMLKKTYKWIHKFSNGESMYTLKTTYGRYEYRPLRGRLWVSFNGPRLIHGHNGALLHRDDWSMVLTTIRRDIMSTCSWIPPSLGTWIVSRIEYPVHCQVGNGELEQWLRLLLDLRLPYLSANNTYEHSGSAYQQNGSRQLISYNKHKQMWIRYGIDLIELQNILRLEMRYRNTAALKRSMKRVLGSSAHATLDQACSVQWVDQVQKDLRRIVEEIALAPTADEAKLHMEMAGWSAAKVRHNLQWLQSVAADGVTASYRLNRQAFYRRRRALATIDLSVFLSRGLHLPEWRVAEHKSLPSAA